MKSDEAKMVFDECGLDFYTQHPYSYEPDALVNAMTVLIGKPLVFTEWGGWLIHNNPNLLQTFKRVISKYAHNNVPDPCLAGMCWWQWQDIYEFMRGLPGCLEGVLSDGLVDASRNRKPMYNTMAEFFDLIDRPWTSGYRLEHMGLKINELKISAKYIPIRLPDMSLGGQPEAWEQLVTDIKKNKRGSDHRSWHFTGPIIPEPIVVASGLPVDIPQGRPLVLAGSCNLIEIPLNISASALHFIGHTTWFDGYPLRGEQGDVLARYVLVYSDGSYNEISLRNGYELASSTMHSMHSRINPIALNAPRIIKIIIDTDWEVYQVNHFIAMTDPTKKLDKLLFERLDDNYCPLLYGITAEL